MQNMRSGLAAIAITISTWLVHSPIQAGEFSRLPVAGERETAQYVSRGERWLGGSVNWYYNPAHQPSNLRTDDVLTTIKIAASRWAQMCNITFNYMGLSNASRNFQGSAVDNVNVIGWDLFPLVDTYSSGITYWNYRSTAMVDADIFLNTYWTWSLSDVDSVVTHEFGHFIGLQHSDKSESIMFANPYHNYAYQRTLRGDDINGCTALYGAAPNQLVNRTLNWAESFYASALVGGPAVTEGRDGMVYRYYRASNSTAGAKDGVAYYTGPDGVQQNMGPLSAFTAQVTAAGY